jgi:flagellar biogenesis protein FliO
MEVLRELLAVALVFSLLGVSLWLLRGRGSLPWKRAGGARRQARRLESLDRLALSAQHSLHLVRAADRVLLLVTHTCGCTLLAQMPPADARDDDRVSASTAALERVLS